MTFVVNILWVRVRTAINNTSFHFWSSAAGHIWIGAPWRRRGGGLALALGRRQEKGLGVPLRLHGGPHFFPPKNLNAIALRSDGVPSIH